jgi:RNA polymerase sigma-70 factor (ECF subfamily)
MSENDFDIIRNVLNGDVNDYAVLVDRYQGAVFNLLFQMLRQHEDAKGLTQEVFVKAYENLGRFNFKSRFFSWIYRIAINTAITYRKQNKRFVSIENLPPRPVWPEAEKADGRERSAALNRAIGRLGDKYKAVILLHYHEQLPYEAIAGVLQITEKKVKSRLFDARKQLKAQLEASGYFSD